MHGHPLADAPAIAGADGFDAEVDVASPTGEVLGPREDVGDILNAAADVPNGWDAEADRWEHDALVLAENYDVPADEVSPVFPVVPVIAARTDFLMKPVGPSC